MNSRVAELVPGRPDAEVAEDLRARFMKALEPVVALLQEAEGHNMEIHFNVGHVPAPEPSGRPGSSCGEGL